MATKTKKRSKSKSPAKKGLSPVIHKGLNEKRMKKGTGGKALFMKQGDTHFVQPATDPSEFREYDEHQFRDGGKWNYVPCAGKNCPLCEDEDSDIRKTTYRFAGNFWNVKEKKMQVIAGPKDLSGRLYRKWKRDKKKFTKTIFEVTKLPTQPVSYEVEKSDRKGISLDDKELIDLDQYIIEQMEAFFGSELPEDAKSALDDDDDDYDDDDDWDEEDDDEDDDEEDEEEEYTRDELEDMDASDLKSVAKEFGIKTAGKKRKEVIRLILKNQG